MPTQAPTLIAVGPGLRPYVDLTRVMANSIFDREIAEATSYNYAAPDANAEQMPMDDDDDDEYTDLSMSEHDISDDQEVINVDV